LKKKTGTSFRLGRHVRSCPKVLLSQESHEESRMSGCIASKPEITEAN
jgi:hypothetical protein